MIDSSESPLPGGRLTISLGIYYSWGLKYLPKGPCVKGLFPVAALLEGDETISGRN
jgi:hypothetical protein